MKRNVVTPQEFRRLRRLLRSMGVRKLEWLVSRSKTTLYRVRYFVHYKNYKSFQNSAHYTSQCLNDFWP